MQMRSLLVPVLAICAVLLASCSQPAAETTKAAKEEPKQYKLHGEVTRLNAESKLATINAEKIEGWMESMSMEYPVRDPHDLSTLHADECIDATVFVQGNDFWVANVKPVDTPAGACVAPKKPADGK
jgi:Cu/Ag efflux protein CusF